MPLRHRSGFANGHTAKEHHEKSSNGANTPPPKELKLGKPFALFLTLCFGALWTYTYALKSSETYALCSKDGDNVHTVNANNDRVQCVVVRDVHIVDTGSLRDIERRWKSSNSFGQIPLQPSLDVRYIPPNSIIVPGISDSHAHIMEYGATQELPLEGTSTISETVSRVKAHIVSNPDIHGDKTKWIRGGGWDHTIWPSSGWPTAVELDADPEIRGRLIVLQSKDCHALWVSTEAMRRSMPFPDTVEGGVIVRDEKGEPTGLFLDNAQDLIKQPELTEEDLLRRFNLAVKDAHARGLTSVHDAGLDPSSLAFFKRQTEKGELPLRIYGMTYFHEDQPYWGNTTKIIIGGGNDRLTARSVKIFADGALRTGGAALYEPYHDNPGTNGFLRLDPEILFDVIPKFLSDGWQVNVHAIGDRANGVVLDAFEASLKGANVTALRPRLEHAQMMTKPDMERLGKLGVIASVQPTHAISDMWYAADRLGPERVKLLYAFRSILESGARITLGSDFPVESMNPLSAFYAAITRLSFDGKSPHGPDGWFPDQRLSRIEALRGITIDPAYASLTEDILGSIEIGKRADLTILSQDIMTIPANTILDTRVIATIMDGKIVYGQLE